MKSFENKKIKSIFDAYPARIRKNLLMVRQIIFDIAQESNDVGEIQERLKWNQPSYLTVNPKSGTTIRLDSIDLSEYAIFVHCQTTLIAEFKEVYPECRYDGNRAIIFDSNNKHTTKIIKHFIYLALSYHSRKKHGLGI